MTAFDDPHRDASPRRLPRARTRMVVLLLLVAVVVATAVALLDRPSPAERLPVDAAALVVATDIAVESFDRGRAIDAAWLERMHASDASIVQQTGEPVPDGRVYVRIDDPLTVMLTTWIDGRRRHERLKVSDGHLVPARLLGAGVPDGSVPGVPKVR